MEHTHTWWHIIRGILFWVASAVGAAALILTLVILTVDPTFTFTFSQTEVQAKVNEKLPLNLPPKGTIALTINEGATVQFLADGQVEVQGSFVAKPTFTKTSHYEGTLRAVGSLVYTHGAFYIKDARFLEQKGAFVLSDRAKKVGTLALKKLADVMEMSPDDAESKFKLSAQVRDAAEEWLTTKLAKQPVYKLDGKKWWHWFANTSLNNVTVSDHAVTASVSLRSVVLTIILGIAVGLIALMAVAGMMMSGGSRGGVEFFVGIADTLGSMATFS